MRNIYIVGIGMGNPDTLTVGGKRALEESDGIIGAKRMVDSFAGFCGERSYEITPIGITQWICEHEKLQTIGVVMSGDVGFFSGATKLIQSLEEKNQTELDLGRDPLFQVELIPGISSLQYFCAKLKKPWGDAEIMSLHGREDNPAGVVQTHEKTFLLTGSDHPVQEICKVLTAAGLGDVLIYVGERLSYEDERISIGTAAEFSKQTFDLLSVMLVENRCSMKKQQISYGFEDELFVRAKVPMTKAEVRSVTLSKLRLKADDCIYDIGAGTGSVSVELALAADLGQVYAIETNSEAIQLIRQNREQFGAWNLHVIPGMAPEAMAALPAPDKVFIGGTKGNMEAVLAALIEKNPKVRVVINAIALESMAEAIRLLKKHEFTDIDIVQLSVARARQTGSYHLMMGQNPVFIISGEHGV